MKPGTAIADPEGLDALPEGTWILDQGLFARKSESGAWWYAHDGKPWEPEGFPVTVVEERCDRRLGTHVTPHRGCILR